MWRHLLTQGCDHLFRGVVTKKLLMPSSVKLKKVPENLVYAVQGTKPILFGPENKKQ